MPKDRRSWLDVLGGVLLASLAFGHVANATPLRAAAPMPMAHQAEFSDP